MDIIKAVEELRELNDAESFENYLKDDQNKMYICDALRQKAEELKKKRLQ